MHGPLGLPARSGPAKPRTTPTNPHQQVDQNAPRPLQETLFQRARALPGVTAQPSRVSVPGARAFWLSEGRAAGPPEAFMIGTEFAHLHPPYDGSLHMMLPLEVMEEVVAKGWGEQHPAVQRGAMPPNTVMVFGPRDDAELEVVWRILQQSYTFATGQVASPSPTPPPRA